MALFSTLLAPLVIFQKPLFQHNFGVVDPGRVYRSAQPGAELPGILGRHGVGSVLNLRGGSAEEAWYRQEIRAAQAAGVDFYDLPMSATRRPSRREILTLLDLFHRCRYPLLIHCKSGSDRTGLASALYLLTSRGLLPEEAEKAFSLAYGHVPVFGPEHLHEPIDEYKAWLRSQHLTHSSETFRSWVDRLYSGEPEVTDFQQLRPGPRDEVAQGRSSKHGGEGGLSRRR